MLFSVKISFSFSLALHYETTCVHVYTSTGAGPTAEGGERGGHHLINAAQRPARVSGTVPVYIILLHLCVCSMHALKFSSVLILLIRLGIPRLLFGSGGLGDALF